MKILFVTAGFPSPIGQIPIYNLLKVLCRSHYVSIICFDVGAKTARVWEEEIEATGQIVRVPLRLRSSVLRGLHSILYLEPMAVQTYKSLKMRTAIEEVFRRKDYDIVVIEQLALGQYFQTVGTAAKVLFPVDAVSRLKWQRFQADSNPCVKAAYFLDYLLTRRYERAIYGKYDRIAFVSRADAEYAIAHRQTEETKIQVLPFGLDTAYFHPRRARYTAERRLVFTGNMGNYISDRGLLWFHRHVWLRLKPQVPDLRLYVVGNSPSERVLELARKDPDIVVTGYVKDLRPYVWDGTIFVSPLQVATGINTRVVQAMAMGKAIVASPLSVEGIGVKDGDHVIVARSADEFMDRIIWLLGDDGKRDRLGARARLFAEEKHSLEVVGDRFIGIVQGVLARRSESYAAG